MATDIGNRKSLSSDLVKNLQRQFWKLRSDGMSGFTFERHSSHYPDAKANLAVYDASGKLIIVGREFSGSTLLWESSTLLEDKR